MVVETILDKREKYWNLLYIHDYIRTFTVAIANIFEQYKSILAKL